MVGLLLELGKPNINFQDGHGHTPLLLALKRGYRTIAEMLLEMREVDLIIATERHQTPLLLAAQRGYTTIVQEFLDQGTGVGCSKDDYGWTPLWLAAPLWWAAKKCHQALIKLLIGTGDAQIHRITRTDGGLLALLAVEGFESELNSVVRAVQAYVLETDQLYWAKRLIVSASANGHGTLVKALLISELSDTVTEAEAMCEAASRGHVDIVRHILDAGRVNVNYRSHFGTALCRAALNGQTEVAELLIGTPRVDLKSRNDPQRQIPLTVAAKQGRLDIVKLLLGAIGVEINSKDWTGQTALDLARQNHCSYVVRALESSLVRQHFFSNEFPSSSKEMDDCQVADP